MRNKAATDFTDERRSESKNDIAVSLICLDLRKSAAQIND
jgi:hypothetical protein